MVLTLVLVKVLRLLPIRWKFPSPGWVKINTDGAARGCPGLATCGGIFRGSMGEFIGAFSALSSDCSGC